MRIKYISCTLFMLVSFRGLAQKEKLLYSVKGLPVKDGIVNEYKEGCGSGGIEIISNSDSVYSVIDGVVTAVYNVKEEVSVTIRSKANQYFTFLRLKSTHLQKGSTIKQGDFVGIIKADDEKQLTMPFIISNNKGTMLSQYQTVTFLKKVNPIICYSED